MSEGVLGRGLDEAVGRDAEMVGGGNRERAASQSDGMLP